MTDEEICDLIREQPASEQLRLRAFFCGDASGDSSANPGRPLPPLNPAGGDGRGPSFEPGRKYYTAVAMDSSRSQ